MKLSNSQNSNSKFLLDSLDQIDLSQLKKNLICSTSNNNSTFHDDYLYELARSIASLDVAKDFSSPIKVCILYCLLFFVLFVLAERLEKKICDSSNIHNKQFPMCVSVHR